MKLKRFVNLKSCAISMMTVAKLHLVCDIQITFRLLELSFIHFTIEFDRSYRYRQIKIVPCPVDLRILRTAKRFFLVYCTALCS